MSLINVIVVLIVIGLLLYAANTWLPMDAKIKQILNVVVVIAVILWLLAVFFPGAIDVRVPTTR
jgi:low temperature requirement protein LtrA